MELSQHAKALTIMLNHPEIEWFKPHDVMNLGHGDTFIGYEASARLSEMAKKYPGMIDSMREGKYVMRRLNRANIDNVYCDLPWELQDVINRHNSQK